MKFAITFGRCCFYVIGRRRGFDKSSVGKTKTSGTSDNSIFSQGFNIGSEEVVKNHPRGYKDAFK